MANSLTDDGDMIVRQLVAGAAKPVLVADFQAFSSAPRLSHLVSGRAEGRPVYQVDPLDALSQDRPYISIADLAAEAVGSFARSQPADGPAIVIGYCSAAALSMHIATLLARSRDATAVLLRPTWPDTEGIEATFATLAANLGARELACPDLDGDPDRCVRRMEELLRGELQALATSQGLNGSADTFGELLLTYRSWLAFLLACRNDSLAGWVGETTVVTVLTEAPDSITVPGVPPGEFEVFPLPVLDTDNPITPEVVELLVARILFRFHDQGGLGPGHDAPRSWVRKVSMSSVGSPDRMAWCRRRIQGLGSMPSSSPSMVRSCWYASSARATWPAR